jgi:hypothetical protein
MRRGLLRIHHRLLRAPRARAGAIFSRAESPWVCKCESRTQRTVGKVAASDCIGHAAADGQRVLGQVVARTAGRGGREGGRRVTDVKRRRGLPMPRRLTFGPYQRGTSFPRLAPVRHACEVRALPCTTVEAGASPDLSLRAGGGWAARHPMSGDPAGGSYGVFRSCAQARVQLSRIWASAARAELGKLRMSSCPEFASKCPGDRAQVRLVNAVRDCLSDTAGLGSSWAQGSAGKPTARRVA